MTKHTEAKLSRRERRQRKRELTGDSPEKLAQRHEPERDWIDRMLWSGGIQRNSRFKGGAH
jgi:hypothetical protein